VQRQRNRDRAEKGWPNLSSAILRSPGWSLGALEKKAIAVMAASKPILLSSTSAPTARR
jgi:hypothetical protein